MNVILEIRRNGYPFSSLCLYMKKKDFIRGFTGIHSARKKKTVMRIFATFPSKGHHLSLGLTKKPS